MQPLEIFHFPSADRSRWLGETPVHPYRKLNMPPSPDSRPDRASQDLYKSSQVESDNEHHLAGMIPGHALMRPASRRTLSYICSGSNETLLRRPLQCQIVVKSYKPMIAAAKNLSTWLCVNSSQGATSRDFLRLSRAEDGSFSFR